MLSLLDGQYQFSTQFSDVNKYQFRKNIISHTDLGLIISLIT